MIIIHMKIVAGEMLGVKSRREFNYIKQSTLDSINLNILIISPHLFDAY